MARTHDLGYGWDHQQLRESLRPAVEAGEVDCWRCGQPIEPGQPWDLGHEDGTGKTQYAGPEHRSCNRRAGLAKIGKVLPARCWCGGGCKVHVSTEHI